MGKNVIPEQVEYFFDACNAKLKKSNHSDFTITTSEALRDFSGSKMNDHVNTYELCGKCTQNFKS